jgi:hypothetical protein
MKHLLLLLVIIVSLHAGDLFHWIPVSGTPSESTTLIEEPQSEEADNWASWLDVSTVAHKRVSHSAIDTKKNWSFGIGAGSQIFSIEVNGTEYLPPQNHPGAPWVDDVLQVVGVNNTINNTTPQRLFPLYYEDTLGDVMSKEFNCKDSSYFIHQAGVYQRDTSLVDAPFYSPIVAEKTSLGEYSTVCWPQLAHTPSPYKSELLYWQSVRDIGDGVVEITSSIYNFGTTELNYLNIPWGGVRESELPFHYLSNPDGSYLQKSGNFGDGLLENLEETGGWAMFSASDESSAQSLSFIFGTDKHRGETGYEKQWGTSRWRYGSGSSFSAYKGMSPRDYFVGVVNPRITVANDDLFYWRWYMSFGSQEDVVANSNSYKDSVDYGFLTFDTAEAEPIPVYYNGKEWSNDSVGTRAGELYDRPIAGMLPIFLMKSATDDSFELVGNPNQFNNEIVTEQGPRSRPYLASYSTEQLLGFGTEETLLKLQNAEHVVGITGNPISNRSAVRLSLVGNSVNFANLEQIDNIKVYSLNGRQVAQYDVSGKNSFRITPNYRGVFLLRFSNSAGSMGVTKLAIGF